MITRYGKLSFFLWCKAKCRTHIIKSKTFFGVLIAVFNFIINL